MRIRFHPELPQWITSSDIAAYHPSTCTIHVRTGLGWRLVPVLAHEFTHWAIHVLGLPETFHRRLDSPGESALISWIRSALYALAALAYALAGVLTLAGAGLILWGYSNYVTKTYFQR